MIHGIYRILTTSEIRNWGFVRNRVEQKLPLLRWLNPFWRISQLVHDNRSFDVSRIDQKIAAAIRPHAKKICVKRDSPNCHRVAYLVTAMVDKAGGHNKLVANGYRLLSEDYECKLFLTLKSQTERLAPNLLKGMPGFDGVDAIGPSCVDDVVRIAQEIVNFNPVILMVYANPDDYWAIAIVALIKRVSQIKVMISGHTSHCPYLGVSFSDVTVHALMVSVYVDQVFRHHYNIVLSKSAMFCGRIEWNSRIPDDNNCVQRRQLNVPDNYLLTVSSGAGYKFFNPDGSSDYFSMIIKMLHQNKNVIHILRVWGNQTCINSIKTIVNESGVQDRFRILSATEKYENFYAAADLYIDSIPIGSALATVDLMRLKVPYVVFANRKNALWSFDDYQRDDYPFVYESSESMLNAINLLLNDTGRRMSEIEKNYAYYLRTFEGSVGKAFLENVISHADCLDALYAGPVTQSYIIPCDKDGNPCSRVFGGLW